MDILVVGCLLGHFLIFKGMEISQYRIFKGVKNGSIGIFKGGSEASAYSRVGLIYLHIQKYVFTYFHIQVYVFLAYSRVCFFGTSIFKGMFSWKVPYSRV